MDALVTKVLREYEERMARERETHAILARRNLTVAKMNFCCRWGRRPASF